MWGFQNVVIKNYIDLTQQKLPGSHTGSTSNSLDSQDNISKRNNQPHGQDLHKMRIDSEVSVCTEMIEKLNALTSCFEVVIEPQIRVCFVLFCIWWEPLIQSFIIVLPLISPAHKADGLKLLDPC